MLNNFARADVKVFKDKMEGYYETHFVFNMHRESRAGAERGWRCKG
jgi:hypothetical protein